MPKEAKAVPFGERVAVGNLECAFADEDVASGKAYTSVLSMESMANVGKGGFAALSVANNHVNDAGNFEETVAELDRRFPEIQFFGTRDKPYALFQPPMDSDMLTNVRTDECRGAQLKESRAVAEASEKIGGYTDEQSIALIGCLERCGSRSQKIFPEEEVLGLVKQLKAEGKIVYVYPHWGKESEYTRYPSPGQVKLSHKWIDAGADGIFGSHSHVYQGRETYKGKPIYYSLGNFCFPHPESRLYEGTHVGLTVAIDNGKCVERFHEFADDGKIEEAQGTHGNIAEESTRLDRISRELEGLTWWGWAKKMGAFNLKKNGASWKIRFRRNFIKTLPLWIVWNLLPVNLLFRAAAICNRGK